MEKYYIKILKKIEENGFKSYIVGGFVRDKLLGKESTDIDIITNATPKDLNNIFDNIKKTYEEYGAVKLQIENHIIDITTFRKELSYNNSKPDKIEYTNDLLTDLKRRDFTINAICMDKNENIIDPLNGINDLNKRLIKTINASSLEFKEDPTRILRALRFMCELDFALDKDIINFLKENKETIQKINIVKKKEELDKIFKSKNVSKFLKTIKKYDLEKQIGIKSEKFVETDTVIGVWSQLEILENFNFTKQESQQINKIKKILEKGKIDKFDIFELGLYLSTIAGEILGINKKDINLIYTNLKVKGIIDLGIKSGEICEILNIKPGKKLGIIQKLLIYEIIDGKLENEKESLIKRLKELK